MQPLAARRRRRCAVGLGVGVGVEVGVGVAVGDGVGVGVGDATTTSKLCVIEDDLEYALVTVNATRCVPKLWNAKEKLTVVA
jgi:hypothetical protein